jgi:CheY-like chemotaxis protein
MLSTAGHGEDWENEGGLATSSDEIASPAEVRDERSAQRAAQLRPGVPVIYMSACSRDTIEKTGRLEEGTDYLEKPFTADNLTQRIRDGLDAND